MKAAADAKASLKVLLNDVVAVANDLEGPNHPATHRARALFTRGRLQEAAADPSTDEGAAMLTAAEEALKKAAKLDPALDGAWNCLGQLFWKKGNLEGAKNCYRAVLARGPNKKTHQAMSMLSRALAKSKAKPGSEEQKQLVAESMDHAKEAVKLDVADGASWYAVGMAYMAAFFADGASGAFYTLVPIRPRSRGERRSLRTFPGGSLRPPLGFNPRPRRLSTPSDAFQLHPFGDAKVMGEILAAPCASSSSSPSSSSRGDGSSHAPSERDGRVAWLHSGSAGVEHILAVPRVRDAVAPLTNARGAFSASLGEWALFASLWFAKKVHAMRASQAKGEWMRDTVGMLQGKTMSIVGYGDIGRACAVRAKAFGMKVVALRRDPSKARSTSNWSPYDRGGVVNAVP